MISCHSRNLSVAAATLVERGAVLKLMIGTRKHYSKVIMYHVEFPAKDGVGPISGLWEAEDSDVSFLMEYASFNAQANKS